MAQHVFNDSIWIDVAKSISYLGLVYFLKFYLYWITSFHYITKVFEYAKDFDLSPTDRAHLSVKLTIFSSLTGEESLILKGLDEIFVLSLAVLATGFYFTSSCCFNV